MNFGSMHISGASLGTEDDIWISIFYPGHLIEKLCMLK